MKKTHLLALSLAAAVAFTSAAEAQIGLRGKMRERMIERLQQKKAEEERPIDLQAILPGARKLTVSYGADPAQALDIYVPPGAPRDAPVIVMVHGGAWKVGDKANTGSVENKLRHWLPKGYVFVSVNYRMLPQAMAYTQAQDVAAAVRWTQDHARDWGASDRKLILMGHSAGAHIVALLSSKPNMVGRPWAGSVVLDSAAMKISTTMAGRHPKFYDEAFGSDPAGWDQASPMDQWTPSAVPMFLICSTKRPDKPCDDARAFQALTKHSGVPMPVLPRVLTHADINRTLGLPGDYTDAVDRFIRERLAQ
ncbi:alpha/beta hydrolase [Caulobacter hibisci]|uniref:Alpha/beta hydrolase n=1 Tax=Caulobacter hibisci TaxID=2035993 RepID=A0ABS0SXV1_9CAUL|nr:alpha/beta hydrolase [Caulobacter hibisci]MBI1684246.1 alpha/beta hydrolase [Caulobacter hibisci]